MQLGAGISLFYLFQYAIPLLHPFSMCGNPTKGAARKVEEELRECSMTKSI